MAGWMDGWKEGSREGGKELQELSKLFKILLTNSSDPCFPCHLLPSLCRVG